MKINAVNVTFHKQMHDIMIFILGNGVELRGKILCEGFW